MKKSDILILPVALGIILVLFLWIHSWPVTLDKVAPEPNEICGSIDLEFIEPNEEDCE